MFVFFCAFLRICFYSLKKYYYELKKCFEKNQKKYQNAEFHADFKSIEKGLKNAKKKL
jgi:hypothetical protein